MIKPALLAALLAAPALAQQVARPAVPSQAQIINLSLLEALVATDLEDLAGVFGFVPEESAAMAMADYLTRDRKALKLFLKKVGADHEAAGGINEWDKQVLLYLVGIDASGQLPPGMKPMPRKVMSRISELALAPPLPLHVISQKRAKG